MANKRVIDLPDLSQEVQEGQYVLVDSAGGTGKMSLKKIVDEAGSFDPAGEYPELYAGNLTTDKAQTDTVPYLFRKTGGTLSRVGERCYDTVIGASVGENQLVQSGATSVTVQSGHKYYAKINGTESLGASTGSAITINDSEKDMVVDLSLLLPSSIVDYVYSLGSTNGIAKLRSWGFLRGYQAYNAGSIESVEVTGKVVRGFNQWDGEWEVGEYDNNGQKASGSGVRCKNYIAILPSANYYLLSPNILYVCFYDADKNFISRNTYAGNTVRTTPNDAYYMTFNTASAYGTTYNNDICINLSSDRNGEYEPYTSQSYDYGTDTLNGIFKLDSNNNLYADGDVKTSDGVITRRYKKVTYDGSEAWVDYGSVSDNNLCFRIEPEGKVVGVQKSISDYGANINYAFVPDMPYKCYCDHGSFNMFYFRPPNDTITTLAAWKTYLASNPITVVYELATPTTEQGDPFPSPQVCYPDGTEEYITSNGVPVGHSTEYPYDLKGLVEGLIDIPDVPSTNGTYVLKATRSASGVVYNWVTG